MPVLNIDDNRFNELKTSMAEAQPIYDKIQTGDTSNVSSSEMSSYSRLYDDWRAILDTSR